LGGREWIIDKDKDHLSSIYDVPYSVVTGEQEGICNYQKGILSFLFSSTHLPRDLLGITLTFPQIQKVFLSQINSRSTHLWEIIGFILQLKVYFLINNVYGLVHRRYKIRMD